MNLLLLLFGIVVANSSVSVYTNKKFGETIPFTFILFVLVFYISGVIKTLTIGVYLSFIFIILSLIYLYLMIKKDRRLIRNNIVTNGFLFFTLIFILLIIFNYNREFSVIDDWSHWGIMAKETFRLRRLHSYPESVVWLHKAYPPFYSLLEGSVCILLGCFKESYCLFIMQLFSLSFFIMLFEKIENTIISKLILLAAILLIPNIVVFSKELVYPSLFYNCIYPDWSIGIFVAYCIYYIIDNDFTNRIDYIFLAILLAGLALTKQISIVFVLLLFAMFVVKLILYRKLIKNKVLTIIPIIASIFVYIIWDVLCRKYQVPEDFSSLKFDVFAIIKYINSTLAPYYSNIFSSFLKAILSRPLLTKPFGISYLFILFVLSISIFLLSKGFREKSKSVILGSIAYFIGGIGYAYIICLSYAYSFNESEGSTLTMYNRYMYLYILIGFVLFFILVIHYLDSSKRNYFKYLLLISIVLLFSSSETINYNFRIDEYNSYITENKIQELLDNVTKDKKVLILWQNNIEKICYYKYLITSNNYENNDYNIECEDKNNCKINNRIFADILDDYDVLFISDYEDSFVKTWKSVTDIDIPYNNTAYWIKKDGTKIYLEMIS